MIFNKRIFEVMQGLKAYFISYAICSLLFSPISVLADHSDEAPNHVMAQGSATNDPMPEASDMTQEEMNQTTSGSVDVASIFWPIVPGTTVADGTFFFKQIKEAFSAMMKFNSIDKAKYYVELSEKRIVEANKLIADKDFANALKSLQMSEDQRKTAIDLKRKAVEGKEDTLELVNEMVDSFEKQKQVLAFFSVSMPAEQKASVDEDLKNIELQISEAK